MFKKFKWPLIFLGTGYLVTRLWGLVSFPLFVDEAYYLRWAKEILSTGNIWVSFSDGKEPLFIWLLTVFVRIFSDPVSAGRLLSVLAGLGTLGFIYGLGKELFNEKGGLTAAVFYLFSPFALVYNRLSILDGWLTFLLTAFIYFLVKAARGDRRVCAILAGTFYGLALITKTIAQMFALFIPMAAVLFPRRRGLVVIVLITLLIYLPLTFAPGFSSIAGKNLIFIYPIGYALTHLKEVFLVNLKMSLKDWLLIYFGLLPFAGIFAAGMFGLVKKNKPAVFLSLTFLLPLLAESFLAKIFFPRYLLFLIIPAFLLNAYLISQIRNKTLFLLTLLIFLIQPLILFWQVELQPSLAGLPVVEKWQFFDGWPSELRAQEQINQIRKLAMNKKVIVATENYGVGEFIKYEFYNDPRVEIKTIPDRSIKIEADYYATNK